MWAPSAKSGICSAPLPGNFFIDQSIFSASGSSPPDGKSGNPPPFRVLADKAYLYFIIVKPFRILVFRNFPFFDEGKKRSYLQRFPFWMPAAAANFTVQNRLLFCLSHNFQCLVSGSRHKPARQRDTSFRFARQFHNGYEMTPGDVLPSRCSRSSICRIRFFQDVR